LRQPCDGSAELLIAQAKRLEPRLRGEFQKLVDSVNGDESVKSSLCLSSGLRAQAVFGPAKSPTRVNDKCKEENERPSSVLDYSRLTVIFADPLLLADFHDKLRRKQAEYHVHDGDFTILRVINKFNQERPMKQPPNVHINFMFEGHVCEVQLILEDFMLIKDYSHKPYEIVRLVQDQSGNNILAQMTRDQRHKVIEHVIAEGVYCRHPGAASYPSTDAHLEWH